jgi:hypothetical protein
LSAKQRTSSCFAFTTSNPNWQMAPAPHIGSPGQGVADFDLLAALGHQTKYIAEVGGGG